MHHGDRSRLLFEKLMSAKNGFIPEKDEELKLICHICRGQAFDEIMAISPRSSQCDVQHRIKES
jgi:hypothetical protein